MKVVMSRYSSDELKDLKKKVESKVDEKLYENLEAITVALVFIIIFIGAIAGTIMWQAIGEDKGWLTLFVIAPIAAIIITMIKGRKQPLFFKYFENKGRIMESPLDNKFSQYIDLAEMGEELRSELAQEPDALVLGYNDEIIIINKVHNKVINVLYMWEWMYDIIKEDRVDFSIFDDEIEKEVNSLKNIIS